MSKYEVFFVKWPGEVKRFVTNSEAEAKYLWTSLVTQEEIKKNGYEDHWSMEYFAQKSKYKLGIWAKEMKGEPKTLEQVGKELDGLECRNVRND